MPLLNGIELGIQIREFDTDSNIFYLASIPDYAIRAFKVRAWEYLRKPVKKSTQSQHRTKCFPNSRISVVIGKMIPVYLLPVGYLVAGSKTEKPDTGTDTAYRANAEEF